MSKTIKIWLTAAASLILLGMVIFGIAACSAGGDFSKFNTDDYETNTHEISEDFSNLSINTDTADILFAPSDDGICKVVCHELEKENHLVSVSDGTLKINTSTSEKKWYDYIEISVGSPKITVYLPKTEYVSLFISEDTGDIEISKNFKFENVDISSSTGDVKFLASVSNLMKVKTSTGDICVENISATSLDLSVTTGKVTVLGANLTGDVTVSASTGKAHLTNVTCKNLISSGSTGDISLNNVIATEKLSIERSTGDVNFDLSDASEIVVKTDTGNVTGTLLSEKVFITKTDTGKVNVPNSAVGGKCEITTDTGDIKLQIQN